MCNYVYFKFFQLMGFLSDLVRREEGASALEYAMMAAMVAMVLVPFVPTVSAAVTAIFNSIEGALQTAAGTGG